MGAYLGPFSGLSGEGTVCGKNNLILRVDDLFYVHHIESGQWFLFLSHSISLAFRERQFHGNRVKQGHWLFSGLFLRHHMGG